MDLSQLPAANRPRYFPVIIGVTGHRDLSGVAQDVLRSRVCELLKDWKAWFDPTLYVLTGLADGADQLVAEVALHLGIPIIAVAPMPLEKYRSTLKDPLKFDDLWCKAELKLVLPDVTLPGLEGPCAAGYHDRQYEQLGVLLARRSHLLLALWDGADDPLDNSGTHAVVRMRLNGDHGADALSGSPMFAGSDSLLDLTWRGPLLRIVTPNGDAPLPASGEAGCEPPPGACLLLGLPEVVTLPPDLARSPLAPTFKTKGIPVEPATVFRTLRSCGIDDFSRIRELNGRIAWFGATDRRLFARQTGYLKIPDLSGPAGEAVRFLRDLQASADTAAQVYQGLLLGNLSPANSPGAMWKKARQDWISIGRMPHAGAAFLFSITVPLAVLFFEIYVHHHGEMPGTLAMVAYLVMVGGAAMYYLLFVAHYNWQNQFQDYRALAEAMRVQLYWAVASVPSAVSDHYLRKQSGELGWIAFTLRGPALWSARVADAIGKPDREFVRAGWIDDQAGYFFRNGPLHHAADETGRTWSQRLVTGGLLLSVVLLSLEFVELILKDGDKVLASWREWQAAAIIVAATLPASAAFFSVSRDLRAHEAHAHSYALMWRIYDRAAKVAKNAAEQDDDFRILVRELGREALAENAEWLVDHRHRPVEQRQ
jgi:hypothetical protein